MISAQAFSASVGSGGNTVSGSFSKDCTVVDVLEIPLPISTTDDPTTIAIPYATLESIAMQAYFPNNDAASNCTLCTNAASSGSPAQTFTLKPNKVTIWNSDMANTNFISANITALYVTNPNAVAGTLRMTLGRNPT